MVGRGRESGGRARLPVAALAALALLAGWLGTAATSAAGARTIHFAGHSVKAPASWPVFRLAERPRMCVRLDRRAVYLGTPATNQRCPAGAIGRRRAILVAPQGAARASALPTRPTRIARAGAVFTGLGFDACSTPSTRTMAAWGSSPYRAIGVYIGGANRACSQPNLTSSWVSAQTAAGWHLIPTYVGLQAPTSSCSSCAKLSASQATAQGAAAAVDAVAQAAAVAIGPGSPIYFDMESYSRTSSATAATLAFLEAWTEKLHALGYVSGVYSSSASGIADLAGALGSGYVEPDDLWIANWNGVQNTADPAVPASAWSLHQRIHQYRGGHDETYGGVTINIDNDYIDGATVGNVSAPVAVRKGRCPKLFFKPHSRFGAFNIRTFNVLHCGNARKVANGSRPKRFGAAGTARVYARRQFTCHGTEVGRTRVIYVCFTATRRSQIRFIRSDIG
jgi:glycoside hydrolase-like protein